MKNKNALYEGSIKVVKFLSALKARPEHIMVPVFFALAASAFEAMALIVMTPLIQGFLAHDYSFVNQSSMIRHVTALLPAEAQSSNTALFALLILALVAAMTLKSLATYLSQIILWHQARKLNHDLRILLIDRYLKFGKLYFDRAGTGEVAQVLMTHPVRIMQALSGLNGLLSAVFLILIYAAGICIISWQLTLVALLMIPLLMLSLRSLINRIKTSSEADRSARAALSQKTVNILQGIPLIQSQCSEKLETAEYRRLSERLLTAEFSIDQKRLIVPPAQEILSLVFLLIMLGFMSVLMARHQAASAASYIVFFYILRRMIYTVHVFNQFKADLASVASPIREVLEVLEDEGKPYVKGGVREFESLKQGIEVKDLTFGYGGGQPILKRLHLKLPRGKMTALVGPSGAGKSTIIHLLLRFYDCAPDAILIDGIDIREYSIDSLRRRVAWVSQDVVIFADTLKNNLLFGIERDVDAGELEEAIRRARLLDVVQKLPDGIHTVIGERGVTLSGGERQRVSIARAMLKKSQILLLDEATSALDSGTENLVQEALNELMHGQTAVVVAHRLSTIRNADHIVYMEDGKALESGAMDDLLALRGKFYQAWQEQKFA